MRNRSIRSRAKRKKREVMDIDITSLLDILVILLVFLLKSYNSSGQVLNVPKGVDLPVSESQQISSSGTVVQVSPTSIWVDDKEVLVHKNSGTRYTDSRNRITPLLIELRKKKAEIEKISRQAPKAKNFSGKINLLVDKTIKYSFLQKIMHTSATAGFSQFNFVVLGVE